MRAFQCKTARNRERGATVIEFAIIAPLLVFLLVAIVELGVLFWAELTMQYAVREGARYAITGRTDLDPNTASSTRQAAVIQAIRDHSMGLFDKVSPRINNVRYDDPEGYPAGLFGQPGQTFVLKIDCSWPVMTPVLRPFFADGAYHFTVATTMRNEAF